MKRRPAKTIWDRLSWLLLIAFVPLCLITAVAWHFWPVVEAWWTLQRFSVNSGRPELSGTSPAQEGWSIVDDASSEMLGTIYNMAGRRMESLAGATPIESYKWTTASDARGCTSIVQFSGGYAELTLTFGNDGPGVNIAVHPGTFDAAKVLPPDTNRTNSWKVPDTWFQD